MEKQYIAFCSVLVIFTVFAPVYAIISQPAEVTFEPSNNSTLLFLGNMLIAPVVFLDGSTPKGVGVDIVHALEKHISRPVVIRAMNWSEAQSLVAGGDADALIQINPTEERLKKYEFSDSFLESQFSIFTRSDTIGISGPSDLRGLNVGVEAGGLPQKVLEKDPEIVLIPIPSFLEGFNYLNEGSLDAVVVDYRVGSYVLATNGIRNIKVTGKPIASSNSSIAVKKGNTRLLNEINAGLRAIKTDGTYQQILTNWRPTEVIFETREQIDLRTYRTGMVILLIIILIVLIWVVTIRKELKRRKAAEENLTRTLDTLDKQVRERTAQLSDANKKLTEEIGERILREDELRVSENRYYVIYDQSPIAIELYDAEGTLMHVNPACLKLFGIDTISVIQNFSLYSDPNLTDELKKKLHQGGIIQYQGLFDFEKVKIMNLYPTSREGTIWLDVIITPLGNQYDQITGFLVQIQDITLRKQAEEAVKKAEETYRNIFLHSRIGLFRTDIITGLMLDANDAVAHFFGYEDRTSLLAIHFNISERYVDLHDREKVISLLEAEGEFQNYELRIRKKDESIVWIRFSARLFWEKGWIEGVAEDITDYKKAVAALADSESRLQLALSGSETGMWELHIPSMAINIDNRAAQLIGYEQTENGSHMFKWGELSHPEDIPLIRQRLDQYLAGLTSIYESEHRIKKGSGEWIWVLVRGKTTQKNDEGYPVLITGTIQNISERRRIQENLIESERRYRDMFELNNAVMLIIDSETTRVVDANRAAIQYYGYAHEDMTRMLISEINVADPGAIKKNISIATLGKGTTFLFKHRLKTGEIRDVEVFSGPIVVNGKQYLHSIVQDITERKRVEEALQQANHKLTLLSSITRHDIGNQLQVIFGYLGLARETDLDPRIHEYIENAYQSSLNIERQLSFTRDYEDIGVHSPVWQDINAVISKAVLLFDLMQILILVEISGVEIYADPLMEKVFYNLIDNAKRYGETITRVRFYGFEGKDGYTIVCEDNGVGIPEELKSKIFNREYYKHTGFGLNLSREILDMSGITIRETGKPGEGARFEILVPNGGWRFTSAES
jgi:PAS domain S-box-containing protein